MSTSSQNDLAAKPPEPDSTTQKMDHSESNQLNGPATVTQEKLMKRPQPDCIDSNGEPDAKRSKVNSSDPVLTSNEIQESTRNGEGERDETTENDNSSDENCQEENVPSKVAINVETVDKETVDKDTVDTTTVDMENEDVITAETVNVPSQNVKTETKTDDIVTKNNSTEKENEEKRTMSEETKEADSSSKTEIVDKENKNSSTESNEKLNDIEEMDTSEKMKKNGDDSTKEKPTKSEEVVVVSSDEEHKPSSKSSLPKISITTDLPKEDLIRKLQEELRNEEAKLLLLKKLRQSQLQPIPTPKDHHALVNQQQQQQQQHQQPQHQQQHHHQQHQLSKVSQSSRNTNANIPPPLVHHGNSHSTALKSHKQHVPQLMRSSQMQHSRGMQQGPPPLVMANRSSLQSLQVPQYQVRHQQVPLSSSTHGHLRQSQSQSYTSSHHVSNSTQNMENQSPASRQAAAKLALRKQLEKTLLQIPPPKPPPPELHFLPSAANNEFIYLVGLEEVVNCILENNKSSKEKAPSKFIQPFQCAQCKSFFTTIWKHDTKSGIMCETCIVSNQKKALKAEHTNRLKTAFVKALQQEQEIEQRMQNQNATNMQQAHSHHQRAPQRIMNPAPTTHRPVQPINYAYLPQMMQKSSQVADRHREYLLDMIPSKGLSQTTGMVWK